jgi:hypothetical protein
LFGSDRVLFGSDRVLFGSDRVLSNAFMFSRVSVSSVLRPEAVCKLTQSGDGRNHHE